MKEADWHMESRCGDVVQKSYPKERAPAAEPCFPIFFWRGAMRVWLSLLLRRLSCCCCF